MTFTEIRDEVCGRMNLASTEAKLRVGQAINRHYKRVTASIGLNTTRFVTIPQTATIGQRYVTFFNIEKIDRIIDATEPNSLRFPREKLIDELRTIQPGSGAPDFWAIQSTEAASVTVLLNNVPLAAYALQADGINMRDDLTSDDEPAFAASYHDILTWYVLSEEYLRKEKDILAEIYETKADKLLKELVFQIADSPSLIVRQGETHGGVAH